MFDPTHERELACIFGIHVDNLVGCGNLSDPYFQEVKEKLKSVFTFREWQDGDNLEYCGSQIKCQNDEVLTLNQEDYIHKVKPIDCWIAMASYSELTSSTSGSLSIGRRNIEGNGGNPPEGKHLRYAKEYADVGLQYRRLGEKDDVTFIAYSDASFATRSDLSSQGGYLLAMCHKDIAKGKSEGHYNVIDWRSWKPLLEPHLSCLDAFGQRKHWPPHKQPEADSGCQSFVRCPGQRWDPSSNRCRQKNHH